jgi:hypothetical protein
MKDISKAVYFFTKNFGKVYLFPETFIYYFHIEGTAAYYYATKSNFKLDDYINFIKKVL